MRRFLAGILLLIVLLLPMRAFAYSIVWMSDTQLYSGGYPDTFYAMTDWIVQNRDARDIRCVFHTGDLVNTSRSDAQWQVAAKAMGALDGVVPYLTTCGNHDVGQKYQYDKYTQYIELARQTQPAGGTFGDGRSRYILFSADGRNYIFLSLSFGRTGPAQEELDWANAALRQNAGRIAVIITHSYQLVRGGYTSQGNTIYREIAAKNPNVFLVLCGHARGASRKATHVDDDGDGKPDRTVYSVLANYQSTPKGGNGYMRILDFSQDAIHFSTYSPLLDDYNYFSADKDDFIIPLPR